MFDLRWGLKLHTSMSFRATALWQSHLALLLIALFAAPAAFGQAKNSPVVFVNEGAVTTSFVNAISLGGSGSPPPAPGEAGQWLKVEFHYGIAPLVGKFQDEVQFKVWIEGLDPDAPNPTQPSGKGVAIALTGSVTYVNVPANKDCYGVFYVHPSTLARYSGERGYEDYDRKFNVHVEAYVGGAKMDYQDKRKEDDPNWFTLLKPVPNLVYRQDQSPFLLDSPDKYAPVVLLIA
jgi:hypothetical protein